MSIQAYCPSCGASHDLHERFAGREVRCKVCATPFIIGSSAREDPPPRRQDVGTEPGPVRSERRPGGREDWDEDNPRFRREDTDTGPRRTRSGRRPGRRARRDWDEEDRPGRQSSSLPVLPFVLGGIVLVVLALCGGVGFFVYWAVSTAAEEAREQFAKAQQQFEEAQQRARQAQEEARARAQHPEANPPGRQPGPDLPLNPPAQPPAPAFPPAGVPPPPAPAPPPLPQPGQRPVVPQAEQGPKEEHKADFWDVNPDPVALEKVPLNRTGSVPLAFGGLLVYSTSADSPFVAMTPSATRDRNQIQVYDLRRMKPVGSLIRGKFDGFGQQLALSPDGAYFATVVPDAPRSTVEVWSVADGRSLHRIEIDPDPDMQVGLLDFAGKDQLFTQKQKGKFPLPETTSFYQVWDLKSGAQVSAFSHDLVFSWKWGGFSPGRKYLVLEHTDNDEGFRVLCWDLTTGKLAGRFHFQDRKAPWGQAAGFAFTPDGRRMAMLWRLGQKPDCWGRLLCWDVQTQRQLVDDRIGYDLPSIDSLWFRGGTSALQWVPDGRGWLLFNHLLLAYPSGRVVGKVYPQPGWDGAIVERRFLDRNHLTSVEGGAFDKKLVIIPFPPGAPK